jgi:antagonist of KipI
MSLRIIKAGLLDTVQDLGRWGYQHLGINPGGAMDRFSAQLANALLGKHLNNPVLEFHFPAAQVMFKTATVICITGADFSPTINDVEIPLNHPVVVSKNTVLKFQKRKFGARAYLSVLPPLQLEEWMKSYSTNSKAGLGGWKGRALQKDDELKFTKDIELSQLLQKKEFSLLQWSTQEAVKPRNEIQFIIGSEWHSLTKEAQEVFQNYWFEVSADADRMGFRLAGTTLSVNEHEELVSSAVSFGTVQLLPNGKLIILMADHQTTGGYPRLAHVITAHLPLLAQKSPNDVVLFRMTDLATAEEKLMKQIKFLREIQLACRSRMEEYPFLNS